MVTIPLVPRTARAIGLAIGERTEGPVFLAADGRRLDRHAAGRIVRRTARSSGIGKLVTPHTLRHAFITAALDAGVPLRDVQDAASHADPRTTMRVTGPAATWTARDLYRGRLPGRRRPVTRPLAFFLAAKGRQEEPARDRRRETTGLHGGSGTGEPGLSGPGGLAISRARLGWWPLRCRRRWSDC